MTDDRISELLINNPDHLTNNELCRLITNTDLKERAVEVLLLRNNVRNDDLCCILECSDNEELRERAAKMLLSREKNNYDLRCLIMHTKHKEAAGKQLLANSPSSDDLQVLIVYTDHKEKAARRLYRLPSVTNDDLRTIIRYTSDLRESAATLLLERSASFDDLCSVIKHSNHPSRQVAAWEKMASQSLDVGHLCYLVSSTLIRNTAVKLLAREALAKYLEVDVSCLVPEKEMIKKIAGTLLEYPGKTPARGCNTTLHLAGWAVEHDPLLKLAMEKSNHFFAAGCLSIPHYAYLFLRPKAEVLKFLKALEL